MEKQGDRYGYTLRRDGLPRREALRRYYKQDLQGMTTHQLREICRQEKIIRGVIDPLDRDELIRVILRYRGAEADGLIRTYDEAGMEALRRAVAAMRWQERTDFCPACAAKLVVYSGAALGFYDEVKLTYHAALVGTNALVVSSEGQLCGVLNVEAKGGDTEALYLTKAAQLPCEEARVKEYSLLLLERAQSEIVRRVYNGEGDAPERMDVYRVPLLDFSVHELVELAMPVAVDFGASDTVAGVYLDGSYFKQRGLADGQAGLRENAVNYALFYDASRGCCASALLPSAVGVVAAEADAPVYAFGYDALRLERCSYMDEGFCVFRGLKRWIWDCEKKEEAVDKEGRRIFVERRAILRAYFLHVVEAVRDRFKCRVDAVRFLRPAKQDDLFRAAFEKILPEYAAQEDEMLDEGAAALYQSISEQIAKGLTQEKQSYKALLLACGGGAADLSSYVFSVSNRRVSYRIDIEAAYENGDAEFGGDRLTFRILQLLKLRLFHVFAPRRLRAGVKTADEVLAAFGRDVFGAVDEAGVRGVYEELDRAYAEAEAVVPTRFRDWEQLRRDAYYKVKNNFYFLFDTAERIKRLFYGDADVLQILLTSEAAQPLAEVRTLAVDKWKLSVREGDAFVAVKAFPALYCSAFEIAKLLRADIYGLVRRFLDEMYERGELDEYALVKLAGQSCKIGLFREALKEFIPGKTLRFGRNAEALALKMAPLEGALRYLRDRKYGFAAVRVTRRLPRLPYAVTGYTHTGSEVELLDGRREGKRRGHLSRNMDDLTLKLYLKDAAGARRHTFSYSCAPEAFRRLKYEEIRAIYGENIPQDDTDNIEGREVKFFVWTEPRRWGFWVVPVYRGEGEDAEMLLLGREQFFAFESEAWVEDFFDGTR